MQDLNDFLAFMFFYKIDFSLKIKLRAFFRCFFFFFFVFFCFFVLLLSNSMKRIPRKKYGIFHFHFFLKYEILII